VNMYTNGSSFITDCQFIRCGYGPGSAVAYGTVLGVTRFKEATIINCNFVDAAAPETGGIGTLYVNNSNAPALIVNCSFKNCSTTQGGGIGHTVGSMFFFF
jgi:hypothetical protein